MKMPHPAKAEQGTPSNGVNPTIRLALVPARSSGVTMTSLELVEFINRQRAEGEAVLQHRDFTAKVPKVLGEGVCEKFRTPYVNPQNGQTYQIYSFPKREACLMAMSYSYELQAKVFDRMTELEAQAAPALPNFFDPVAAARAWANVMEAEQVAVAQLALAAPKVAFVDRYVATPSGAMGFRQVCKLLEAKENQFRDFLLREKIMYYLEGALMPHAQHHPATGRFVVRAGAADSGHKYKSAKFSPKGVAWIAGLWEKECQRLAETEGA